MPKYHGAIGFGVQREIAQDVWDEVIEERTYYGDLTRNSSRNENNAKLNDDVVITNTFSIVADPFAYQNYSNIKYIMYMGVKWKVTSVDASTPPRIVISAGGVYNAPGT